jgi:uncharacterized protein
MAQAHTLYRLQQIDSEMKAKKTRLLEVLQAQKESAEMLAARGRVETAVAELHKWQAQHKHYSLEMEALAVKIKQSEDRLYSGSIKNPKELADLEKEIKSLGRRRTALEDDILETMVFIEDAEGEKLAAEVVLTEMETKRESAMSGLQKEQNALALRLHHLTQDRKMLTAEIDATSLQEYETLRQRKNGVAVAKLRVNQCQACFTTVSATIVKKAEMGEMVYCGGCGRILVS